MPTIIKTCSEIECVGTKPKIIQEYIGRVNSNSEDISIAKMTSPSGWSEPGQIPEFDEYTFVISGTLKVETRDNSYDIHQSEVIIAHKGEWIRYSTPYPEGAEYIAVCLPAFSPEIVNRDE